MHLGNGAITTECALLTIGAAATGLSVAAVELRRRTPARSQVLLAAGLGAFVFAAQAINVPVLPASSAHLVGGMLLAWILGPSLGLWTMAVVLSLQALLMGDGGWMALGANILNMGVLPAAIVASYRRWTASEAPVVAGNPSVAGLVAAIAVPLAAGAIALETIAFRSTTELAGWNQFALQMLLVHLWIGVGEGLLTAALVLAYKRFAVRETSPMRDWAVAGSLVAIGLAVVLVLLPFASGLPDGYEFTAERAGMSSLLTEDAAALASLGELPSSVAASQHRIVEQIAGIVPSELLLVAMATLLTAGATLLVASGLTRVPVPVRR